MTETLQEQVANPVAELHGTESKYDSATFFNSYVGFVEATRITGRNKSIISRDTKSGKLPFLVTETGQKQYKVADLQVAYGLQKPKEPSSKIVAEPEKPVNETVEVAVELAVLKERLRAQDEMLRVKDSQIRDLQENRDKLLDQTTRLTLLLSAPPEETLAAAPPPEKKRPWWSFSR